MKTLIGGAIAAALGLIGLVIWWGQFLIVLAGIVPAMLLLGGALAIYLGFDELRDSWKSDEAAEPSSEGSEGEGAGEEVEQYKKETDDLKEEIETPKKE
jgi:phosphate/sulfate permease